MIGAEFEATLEERPAVFSSALGTPGSAMVRRCHERGIKVVAMVATVDDARQAAADGADVVVAQGSEAGGHRSIGTKPSRADDSSVGIMALLPQVVDAVRVPVVAAGGIADGRGLVAALALGASGVLLGTRFAATRESTAPEFRKKAILEAGSEATVVTDSVSGLWARYLRNAYITEYEASGAPVLPALLQTNAAQDIFTAATQRQDSGHVAMATGQSVGLIHDLPGAAEVVEAVIREARAVLASLTSRVRID
jgi:nitronate monooxygenase